MAANTATLAVINKAKHTTGRNGNGVGVRFASLIMDDSPLQFSRLRFYSAERIVVNAFQHRCSGETRVSHVDDSESFRESRTSLMRLNQNPIAKWLESSFRRDAETRS